MILHVGRRGCGCTTEQFERHYAWCVHVGTGTRVDIGGYSWPGHFDAGVRLDGHKLIIGVYERGCDIYLILQEGGPGREHLRRCLPRRR